VDAARCLAQAVRSLDRIAREADHQTRPAPLAALASNGRVLVGVRRGLPLHYALLEGISTCEVCEIDERTPESDPRRAEHRRQRGVAIATTSGPGFLEVPDGSTVAVGRSLEITVASV
jgi:glutamine amidotransferase